MFGSLQASPKAANYNYVIFTWTSFLFILHLSSLLVAQTNLERKLLLKGHLHENMRVFVPLLCSHIFFLDDRIIWPWNPGLLLPFNGSAWTLASSSLIWAPTFCLQTFMFSVLKFPMCFSLSHHHPLSCRLAHCLCLPLSQFCSSALLLWKVTSGECTPPPQLHTERKWRRHTWQTMERIHRNICQAKRLDEGFLL